MSLSSQTDLNRSNLFHLFHHKIYRDSKTFYQLYLADRKRLRTKHIISDVQPESNGRKQKDVVYFSLQKKLLKRRQNKAKLPWGQITFLLHL